MTEVLTGRYRIHVAYQCAECTWGGMVALGFPLTNHEMRQWFACPVHPSSTEMNLLDREQTEERRKH